MEQLFCCFILKQHLKIFQKIINNQIPILLFPFSLTQSSLQLPSTSTAPSPPSSAPHHRHRHHHLLLLPSHAKPSISPTLPSTKPSSIRPPSPFVHLRHQISATLPRPPSPPLFALPLPLLQSAPTAATTPSSPIRDRAEPPPSLSGRNPFESVSGVRIRSYHYCYQERVKIDSRSLLNFSSYPSPFC